jgi:putative toxin-antitoxin system antitoxin component (TIGR02293 family)
MARKHASANARVTQALGREQVRGHDRESVISRAVQVIGDEQMALRWLGTPVPALDYSTPISLLNNSEGQSAVLRVLTQLEHGVL